MWSLHCHDQRDSPIDGENCVSQSFFYILLNQFYEYFSHYSANACLMPLCMLFGKAVTTVEGIGNVKKMHPVQERMAL